MYRIVFLLISSLLIANCSSNIVSNNLLPYYNEPSFTPIFIKNQNEITNKIKHKIDRFSFINQDSLIITDNTIEDKIHVANFVFTRCGSICPSMTKNMKIVSDKLQNSDKVIFLSYSVTPWIDSPDVLKKYKQRFQISNKNWHFLTGAKSDIYSLARKSYFAEEEIGYSKDSTEFMHTEHFILVDKNKRIRGIYNGTLELDMQQLIEDIHSLTRE